MPDGGRIATVTGAVVLGGESSRMGRDKAHVELAGVSFATRAARLLATLFDEVLLVGGSAASDGGSARPATGALGGSATVASPGSDGGSPSASATRTTTASTSAPQSESSIVRSDSAVP